MWPKYDVPFFFHIRDREDGEATVCFVPVEPGTAKFAPGVAVCRADNYNKKVGRAISLGRAEVALNKSEFVSANNYDELSNVAKDMATNAINRVISRFSK